MKTIRISHDAYRRVQANAVLPFNEVTARNMGDRMEVRISAETAERIEGLRHFGESIDDFFTRLFATAGKPQN